jgi:hypothetical protein
MWQVSGNPQTTEMSKEGCHTPDQSRDRLEPNEAGENMIIDDENTVEIEDVDQIMP